MAELRLLVKENKKVNQFKILKGQEAIEEQQGKDRMEAGSRRAENARGKQQLRVTLQPWVQGVIAYLPAFPKNAAR